MKKIGVLVSGNGSNLQALLEACKKEREAVYYKSADSHSEKLPVIAHKNFRKRLCEGYGYRKSTRLL